MKDEGFRQEIRLRLLALVLALALTWYVMNPAPSPVRWVKKEEEAPDEKHREAKSTGAADFYRIEDCVGKTVPNLSLYDIEGNTEDLEWPELIDGD